MPLINVKVIEGVFDAAQKRKIVENLVRPSVIRWSEAKLRFMRGAHVNVKVR